jgi:hypothetical protein
MMTEQVADEMRDEIPVDFVDAWEDYCGREDTPRFEARYVLVRGVLEWLHDLPGFG